MRLGTMFCKILLVTLIIGALHRFRAFLRQNCTDFSSDSLSESFVDSETNFLMHDAVPLRTVLSGASVFSFSLTFLYPEIHRP
ncbi:hypothetical protein GcC1_c19870o21 [Golovinomyces cichoracearum]|uniref:Secreted protein n=1 Tax=Golovinomyces cichoracearum TaxID=62708 RepID=A0A420IMH6_9PEZI|nr:hypothetical protein GcC1_c19870o21 [Golovinomyces cichoracearum]